MVPWPNDGGTGIEREKRITSDDSAGELAGSGTRQGLSRRGVLYVFAALTLAGLLLRILWFDRYTFAGSDCDGAAYMHLAQNFHDGAGWVTNSLRFLFLAPRSLPYPDAHWSPLYPFLTSLSYGAFGTSFASAKLVPLAFGALVPGVVFLMTMALTRSGASGVVAGVLAVFHPTLVTWSLRVMTEIASTFFVVLVFYLLLRPSTRAKAYWLGIALGLAYLMKYQSVLLWAPVLLYYALNVPWRTAIRRVAVMAGVFVVVISPWLVRNALAFGDPFYTDLRYNFISYYPQFGGEPRYLSSLTVPPGTFDYVSAHLTAVLAYAKGNVRLLLPALFHEDGGSALLVPFALLGVVCALRDWRRWTPPALFALLLLGIVAASVPQTRYLQVLVPLWIALAAAGAGWLLETRGGRRVLAIAAGVVLLLAVAGETRATVAAVSDTKAVWSPSANYCVLEAEAVAGFVDGHTAASEPVFAPETFHYALILHRNTVGIPFDQDDLLRVAGRYNIRYLVVTTRDLTERLPSWVTTPPDWAHLVYEVPAGEIPRPAANPSYPYVSDVRVYELSRP